MCGIAGLLGHARPAAELERATAAMIATLAHRGPDDEGVESGEGWALGMRRLAVQDTTLAGHQPMWRDGLGLVFNGEVFNFPELRRELSGQGYDFASGSDTEVVLAALHRWGPGALRRFNGMFALCLLDTERRRALLARDRFGKKPLFVARLRAGIAFASELKAIHRIAREELTIDRDAMAEYFRLQYVPAPRSIYAQVRKLPPASYAWVDLDRSAAAEPETFWSLPPHDPTGAPAAPEEVREAIERSVRRRLIADVPVGAFLSGGTDSSLVVAGMTAAAADARTFSIGFADPAYDESRWALAVAGRLGTEHTHLQLEPADALGLIPRLETVYDEPFADASAIPTLAVAALARRRVTVALSGDGGDELFGGYLRYRAGRRLGLARLVPGPVLARLGGLPGRSARARRLRALSSLAAAGDDAARYREVVSIWRSPDLRRLMGGGPGDSIAAAFGPAEAGVVTRMMRCDLRTYLVDDILQKVDRASMSVSLEARNPLLDPDVVALALRSTARAEAAPGGKALLRDTLRLALPDELVDRPKQGFGVPVGAWLRTELRPLVEDLVLGRREAEYDLGEARRVCAAHLAGRHDATAQVWSLLVLELWRRRWG